MHLVRRRFYQVASRTSTAFPTKAWSCGHNSGVRRRQFVGRAKTDGRHTVFLLEHRMLSYSVVSTLSCDPAVGDLGQATTDLQAQGSPTPDLVPDVNDKP